MIKENNILTEADGYVKISFIISDNDLIESITFSIYNYSVLTNSLLATVTNANQIYTIFLDYDKFNVEVVDFSTYLSRRIDNVLFCEDILQISNFMVRYFKYNKLF